MIWRVILLFACLALDARAALVVGTNLDIVGGRINSPLVVSNLVNPEALTNGLGVGGTRVFPVTNGVYALPLVTGRYSVSAYPYSWIIDVPDTNATLRMIDLIVSGVNNFSYSNVANIYGVKVSSIDQAAGFLSNKIVVVAPLQASVTNIGGNEQIVLTSSGGGGVSDPLAMSRGTWFTTNINVGVSLDYVEYLNTSQANYYGIAVAGAFGEGANFYLEDPASAVANNAPQFFRAPFSHDMGIAVGGVGAVWNCAAGSGIMSFTGEGVYFGSSQDDGTGTLYQFASDINCGGIYWVQGFQGATGSFTAGSGETVTVVGGIITAIASP